MAYKAVSCIPENLTQSTQSVEISSLRFADRKHDRRSRWVVEVADRRGRNVAAVALANKTVRTAWVLLTKGEEYRTIATA